MKPIRNIIYTSAVFLISLLFLQTNLLAQKKLEIDKEESYKN